MRNDNLPFVLLMAVLLAVSAFFLIPKNQPEMNSDFEVKAGQVWRYVLHEDNPFREPKTYDALILDVKGDYALYIENGDTLSGRKSWFRFYKLIKN
ncbi:hypothetical protein [Pontibacter sp. H249]|uniref:hypothetical protein n=1 Tax=Pontibacter sp. H249 TaxID=3133420 RepID=UPI0030BE1E16